MLKIQKSPNGDYAIMAFPLQTEGIKPSNNLKLLLDFVHGIQEQEQEKLYVELVFHELPKSWNYILSVYNFSNRVKSVIRRKKKNGEIVVANKMVAYSPYQFDADYWFRCTINIPLPIMGELSKDKIWRLYFGASGDEHGNLISAWAFKPSMEDIYISFILKH